MSELNKIWIGSIPYTLKDDYSRDSLSELYTIVCNSLATKVYKTMNTNSMIIPATFDIDGTAHAIIEGTNAQISSVKGKTVKFNQLINPTNFPASSTSNNVTFTPNADGTITVVVGEGGASTDTFFSIPISGIVVNNKYLLKGCPSGGNESTYTAYIKIGTYHYDIGNGAVGIASAIATTTNIRIKNGCPAGTYVFKPNLIDLTANGDGDLTLEQAMDKYNQFYGYDSGSLKNSLFSGIKEYDSSSNLIDGVTFDDIELKGVGTAQDEINLETNKKITRCATIVLNGTQETNYFNWHTSTNTFGVIYPYALTNNKPNIYQSTIYGNYISNKLQNKSYDSLFSNDIEGCCFYNTNEHGLIIRLNKSKLTEITKTALNSYLASNPITVTYELATSTEEDIALQCVLRDITTGNTIDITNENSKYGADCDIILRFMVEH